MADQLVADWPSAFQYAPFPTPSHQDVSEQHVARPWMRGQAVFTGPPVTIGGAPGVARLVLLDALNLDVLEVVYSAPDGTWEIAGGWEASGAYVVMGFDTTGVYRPIVYDQV